MNPLGDIPPNHFPRIPWDAVKPNYSHIKDPWVKAEFEAMDKAVFLIDLHLAQVRFLLRSLGQRYE